MPRYREIVGKRADTAIQEICSLCHADRIPYGCKCDFAALNQPRLRVPLWESAAMRASKRVRGIE